LRLAFDADYYHGISGRLWRLKHVVVFLNQCGSFFVPIVCRYAFPSAVRFDFTKP
jgi:hypothetical protein